MANLKSAGLSKTLAKKTVNNVTDATAKLERDLDNLCNDVEELNKEWYGGKNSKKWYSSAQVNYESLVNYIARVNALQTELRNYISGYDKL